MSDGDFQKEFCSHPKRYLAKAISYRECRKNDINENAEFNNDGISDYRLVYIGNFYESYEMSHKIAVCKSFKVKSNRKMATQMIMDSHTGNDSLYFSHTL